MCGRYSLICIDDLGNRFRVHNPMIGARSRFNIAPGNEMPVIIRKETNEVVPMRWGLVPRRAPDLKAAVQPFNARAEALCQKFSHLLKTGRCLVPASGFYEWKNEGRRRIPFYFYLPDEPIFAFAGLCDTRHGPDDTPLPTYTIITCEPNALVSGIHSRMPVILSREHEDRWLSPDSLSPLDLARILVPYPSSCMAGNPVSGLVNSPAVDDERLIRPLFGLT